MQYAKLTDEQVEKLRQVEQEFGITLLAIALDELTQKADSE